MNPIFGRSTAAVLSAAACLLASPPVAALSNSAKVPILLYHTYDYASCTYDQHALLALAQDLETMEANNYKVMPLYWIAQWIVGDRDGSTMPDKVVGITFDDGPESDWVDANYGGCGTTSAKAVLNNFKAAHSGLPWNSPHATSFVLSSPVARGAINSTLLTQSWWASAQSSGIMEIYNHSADHDHVNITSQLWDPYLFRYLPAAGYGDGDWFGKNQFSRINTYQEADVQVARSAAYISGVIGVWPDLFAYPFGGSGDVDAYMINTYFPTYGSEHGTYAAFCTGNQYASRSSNRWCIPRFTHRSAWATTATDDVMNVLSGAP